MKIEIKTRLPGLNDYISAINHNRYAGNKLKRDTEAEIMSFLYGVQPVEKYPLHIEFVWYERTKRRDLDNVASAKKFILDALQKAKIIKGDGQKYVGYIRDRFLIPAAWDGCIVKINQLYGEWEEE